MSTTMSSESLVQNVDTDDPVDERLAKREKNRKGLHQLLNPAAMSAEQNKTIKNYPTTGWQDGTCTGRWDGFQAIWGTYKLVPEQDHALRFLTYVPNEVGSEPSPLLISWHGGGFFTGAADYVPWDAQYIAHLAREVKAVVVSFNYRLLPYVDGSSLLSDVEDALHFMRSKSGLQDFLSVEAPSTTINWEKVMVTGESAGGFLAAYTWLKSEMPLQVIYLRYPMLVQYQREARGYGGAHISKDNYAEMVHCAMDEVERIKRSGEPMPAESSLLPPINMPAANIFSSTARWKDMFQHHDILQMLEYEVRQPRSCPVVFVVHGEMDAACPIENSIKFEEEINKRGWAKGPVNLVAVPDMDHAFDYNLNVGLKGVGWLGKLMPKVREAWVGE